MERGANRAETKKKRQEQGFKVREDENGQSGEMTTRAMTTRNLVLDPIKTTAALDHIEIEPLIETDLSIVSKLSGPNRSKSIRI